MKLFFTTTAILLATTNAFSSTPSSSQQLRSGILTSANIGSSSLNALNSNNDNEISERRTFMRNLAGVAFGASMGMLVKGEPASASYSAYTNREKDWQERKESGGKTALDFPERNIL